MASNGLVTAKQCKQLYESMDEVTQEIATAIVKKIQDGTKVHALVCWDVGKLVNRIFESKHLEDEAKRDEMAKLSAYLGAAGLETARLGTLRNVYLAWPSAAEYKALLEEKMENGNSISFTHLVEVQKLSTPTRREAMLKQIRKNSMSVKEVIYKMQAKREGSAMTAGTGRAPKVPKDCGAIVQKEVHLANSLINFVEAGSEAMLNGFLEMPADEIDETVLDHVELLKDRLTKMMEITKAQLASVTKIEKRFEKVKQQEVAEAEDSDEDEEEEEEVEEEESEEVAVVAAKKSSKAQADEDDDEDEEDEEDSDEDEEESDDEESEDEDEEEEEEDDEEDDSDDEDEDSDDDE